ncbi:MAG: hypothetical protein HYV27_09865 [Candidatus Hydrogenedentes bacterium]|nr:hypothetical protein [Candidatus Hydrogenedentota bacterium]
MDLFSIFRNPTLMHAAVVHLPLALAVFGFILLIVCALFHRNNAVRWITLLAYAVLVASTVVAFESGEGAQSKISSDAPQEVWELVNEHEDNAHLVQYLGIATTLLLAASLVPHLQVRAGMLLLATVSGLITLFFGAFTGHLGGTLVYQYGVGRSAASVAPPAPAVAGTEAIVPASGEAPAAKDDEKPVTLLPIEEIDMGQAALVSYQDDILPIIEEFCIDCHEAPDADGNYDMTSVANMLKAGEKSGPGILPGNPDGSPVVQYIRGHKRPQMPKGDPVLDPMQLHMIRMWIAAGAKDDSPGAVTAPAPEVVPEVAPVELPVPMPEPALPPAEAAPVPVETPAAPAESSVAAPPMEEEAVPVPETPAPVEPAVPVEETPPALPEAEATEPATPPAAPEIPAAPPVPEEAAPPAEAESAPVPAPEPVIPVPDPAPPVESPGEALDQGNIQESPEPQNLPPAPVEAPPVTPPPAPEQVAPQEPVAPPVPTVPQDAPARHRGTVTAKRDVT